MKLKTFFACLAGAAVFLLAAAAVWLWLTLRVLNGGGTPPHLVPDRVAALLFALAFGSALAAGGYVFAGLRKRAGLPLGGLWTVVLVVLVPFFGTFVLLLAAHSQLPSMQFTNAGKPVSPWGYLIICGLPVVVGLWVGAKLEGWFPTPPDEGNKGQPESGA